ncbi:MAG: helix-turn-helix transcriptional regulator [Candidatus Methanoperedens sp.]|nr:helix-turn-helix transcriptional regulator [Candidatus Methanoperedens sp.]MCE8424333.1 helix-turn-helix transcriptional regulator [Candidatus Methanoperedens sp.]MCE8427666.1 helix-turn-helix transcriptional regulator [Candidatus Methanoperedens sp.]
MMKDDIDSVPLEADACEIKTPHDHQIMFRTLENPLRRKIVKAIGTFGKTKKEIMKELDISGSQLQFQLDYLVKMCYLEVHGENCRLNSKGVQELLANIK